MKTDSHTQIRRLGSGLICGSCNLTFNRRRRKEEKGGVGGTTKGRGGSGEKRERPQQKPVDAAQRDVSVADSSSGARGNAGGVGRVGLGDVGAGAGDATTTTSATSSPVRTRSRTGPSPASAPPSPAAAVSASSSSAAASTAATLTAAAGAAVSLAPGPDGQRLGRKAGGHTRQEEILKQKSVGRGGSVDNVNTPRRAVSGARAGRRGAARGGVARRT